MSNVISERAAGGGRGAEVVFRNMSSVSGGDARREGVLLSTCTRIEAVANRNPT